MMGSWVILNPAVSVSQLVVDLIKSNSIMNS